MIVVVALLLALTAAPLTAAEFGTAYAELDAARGATWCDPIDGRLARAIAKRLGAARTLLERAEDASRPARAAALLARVDGKLAGIATRALRAETRGRIDAACRSTIEARVVALRAVLATLAAPAEPLPGLPDDVAGYETWLRLNAAPIPPAPGFDPHNGTKNVFVNRSRDVLAPDGTQRFPYPAGSIVVKAAVRDGEDFVYLFAIMRKRPGSDPAHADWQFVEYFRSTATAAFREAARDAVCWGCHGVAADSDYVYTRLDPAR